MNQIMIGQVGVHRVAAELLLREWAPYFPSVYSGIDLVVNGIVRLQVKTTSRIVQNAWKKSHYNFTLKKSAIYHRRSTVPARSRVFSQECDFVVCHAADSGRFWVIPAATLDGKSGIVMSATGNTQWRDIDWKKIHELRQAGRSLYQISDETGVPFETVRRRLARPESKRTYTNMAQYEGRWDFIGDALRMVASVNEVDQPRTAVSVPSTV